MVRYSFLVRLSHPLLHAGLSRRFPRPLYLSELFQLVNNVPQSSPPSETSNTYLTACLTELA